MLTHYSDTKNELKQTKDYVNFFEVKHAAKDNLQITKHKSVMFIQDIARLIRACEEQIVLRCPATLF